MTYDSLSISELIPAPAERIYAAWLSSAEHSAFTGDKAIVEPFVGGKHSTFDGYAVGLTLELQPGRRIVQTWRAEDFPIGSPDSRIEVTLEETVGGTMLTIFHTEIPSGLGTNYRDSWLKYYLEPLKGYFVAERPARKSANGVRTHAPIVKAKPAKAKAKAKTRARPAAKKIKAKAKPARTAKKTAARKKSKVTARPKAKRAPVARRQTKKSGPTRKKARRRS